MKYLLSSTIAVALLLGNSCGASAQTEITLLAPNPAAWKDSLTKLVADFESKTGDKVTATFAVGSRDSEPYGTKQLVARGQGADVSIMFAPFPDALASGNIVPGSATKLGKIVLAVSVRKGAPMPDISTPAAVKRMLLEAKSIAIVDPKMGTLGYEAADALKKLGMTEQLQSKIKAFESSPLAEASVAKGESELFLGPQVSDKIAANIDAVTVGGLPKSVATPVDVVGYVSTHAKDPKAAKALLQYLKSPEAEATYKAAGIEPAH